MADDTPDPIDVPVDDTPATPDPDPAPQRDADAEVKKAYEKLRNAEKEAARLTARLKSFEEAQLSEQEKLARRAEEAEAKAAQAEDRIRRANLLVELSRPEHGIVDARAALKLIEGVEFTDTGDPANLDTVLPTFLEEYAFLKARPAEPVKPRPPAVNAGEGTGTEPQPDLTAEELAAATQFGISPERYAAMKRVKTLDDYKAVRAKTQ